LGKKIGSWSLQSFFDKTENYYTFFIVISQTKLEFSLTLLENMKLFLFRPKNLTKLLKINSSVISHKEIFELIFVKGKKLFLYFLISEYRKSSGERSRLLTGDPFKISRKPGAGKEN